MAITFVGSATGTVINGDILTVSLTGIAGLAENDIVLAFGSSNSDPAITANDPSGYTSIDFTAGGAGLFVGYLSYKIQTSTVDTSLTFWDTGTTADSGTAIAMAFRGIDTTTPLDVTTVELGSGLGTTFDPSAITPVNNNACIVIFGAGSAVDSSIGTVASYTQPTAHTATSSDTNSTTIAAAYRILVGGAGSPEDPAAWSTWTQVSGPSVMYTVALRPFVATGHPAAKRMGGVRFVGGFRNPFNTW